MPRSLRAKGRAGDEILLDHVSPAWHSVVPEPGSRRDNVDGHYVRHSPLNLGTVAEKGSRHREFKSETRSNHG